MPVEVYAVKVCVKNDRFAEAGNLRRSAWKGHASHGRILGRPALFRISGRSCRKSPLEVVASVLLPMIESAPRHPSQVDMSSEDGGTGPGTQAVLGDAHRKRRPVCKAPSQGFACAVSCSYHSSRVRQAGSRNPHPLSGRDRARILGTSTLPWGNRQIPVSHGFSWPTR